MAMKPKVLLTRNLPRPGIDALTEHVDLEVNPIDGVMFHEEIKKRITDKDGLICLLTDTIDAEVIGSAPRLKIIANYAVGFNNIDLAEATKKGIAVTNTPDVLTETTADFTFGLLIAIARRIVEADLFLRDGRFEGWAPELMLGADVHGKILGLVGFGRIGKAVARRARGFGMRIVYHDARRLSDSVEKEHDVQFRSFKELLSEADFVSIHAPLTEQTHHLFSSEEFNLMKNTSYLINAARGPIVDEIALVKAINNKQIAGVALDVYESEPRVEPELLGMTNVILVPHIGSASTEARTKMALMVADNILAVFVKKKQPPNIVNTQIYRHTG